MIIKMKRQEGITLIALVITIIIVGMIIIVGVQYAKKYINNQEIEDIKSSMLVIQGVITNIGNKHEIDEENNTLLGVKLELENNETGYNISEELKSILEGMENANLYILNQEELNNIGVKDVEINNSKFYIVDYNSGEVFYSLGINGKYKLSEI